MRTDEEILARIKEVEGNDWLGTERGDLIEVLPFEHVKPFLKDGVKEEEWTQIGRDVESVKARMLDYMPFAWEKANNCRGISASRSMSHFAAWAWLIGEDFGDLQEYEFYGKPRLIAICDRFGWDHKQWDDGERTNTG